MIFFVVPSVSDNLKTLNERVTPEVRLRMIGILPFMFFLVQFVHYLRVGQLGHLLWMCNIGNLLLAIGLFWCNRRLTRVAIIWTIPGLFIWFIYVVLAWGVFFSSTLAHVGLIVDVCAT